MSASCIGKGIYEAIVLSLTTAGTRFSEYDCSMATMAEAGELPFPRDAVVKALVFSIANRGYLVAVVRATDKVDYRKMAQAAGASRGDLMLTPSEEVEAILGFAPGTVSPVCPQANPCVLLDASLAGLPTVYCGAGIPDKTLGLRFEDLVRVTGARVADLVKR